MIASRSCRDPLQGNSYIGGRRSSPDQRQEHERQDRTGRWNGSQQADLQTGVGTWQPGPGDSGWQLRGWACKWNFCCQKFRISIVYYTIFQLLCTVNSYPNFAMLTVVQWPVPSITQPLEDGAW